jgi:hypothetical protein
MKKLIRYFSYLLMLALTSTLFAQTPELKQDLVELQKDSSTESLKPAYHPVAISWWDCGNGFIYQYTIENTKYITRFDKQGNYVETLTQKIWSDSCALRSSFEQSQYKHQKVVGYWEVTDANRKGYYLEMSDGKNQVSGVWVDDQGNFSTIPVSKPKQ